jgi:hypothetical protein
MLRRAALAGGALLVAAVAGAQDAAVRACDPADAARVGALWTSIRAALESVERTRAQGAEPLAIERFDRTLDREGAQRSEARVDSRRMGTRPFGPLSAEALSRDGYVQDSAGVARLYPIDAALLIVPDFTRDHCYGIVAGSDLTAGMIGLSFHPRAGRRMADVRGVLWSDADSSLLRFVEFSYVSEPAQPAGVGGRLMFEKLPSGRWITRDWVQRTPVATQSGLLLGFREQGGEAMTVSPAMLAKADSVRNSRLPPGRISGVVIDSLTMGAFKGARVWIDSGGPEVRTDSLGTFTLARVAPGSRRILFTHPTLDSMGLRPRAWRTLVISDSTTHVALGGPSFNTLKYGVCPDSAAVLTGLVTDVATGTPVPSATVSFAWVEFAFAGERLQAIRPVDRAVETDERGNYAACVAPFPEITVSASVAGARTGAIDLRPDGRGIGIVHLAIDRTARDTLVGTAVLRGVVKYQDGTPIPLASVTLTDPDRVVTADSAGVYVFTQVPGGTRALDARARGYAPSRMVVVARPNDTTDATIYLRQVNTLDAVIVRAHAGDEAANVFAELEERRRLGVGFRLTQLEMLSFQNSGMSAVLRSLPFVRVKSVMGMNTSVRLINARGQECSPSFWRNGRPFDVDMLEALPARDVLAIEVFSRYSDLPTKYQNGNECGAILVWSRDAVDG